VAIVSLGGVLFGLTLLAAGCGGRAAPRVAAVGTTNAATATNELPAEDPMAQAVRFAGCMRAHGLPNYPDPQQFSHGSHQSIQIETPNLNSPQAQAAAKACSRFLPSGATNPVQDAQQRAHLLAFARCMRTHEIPDFPDPTSIGGFPPTIARVDRSSPVFRAAAKTCLPAAAGAVSFGAGPTNSHSR
jgi:hypothetical protein